MNLTVILDLDNTTLRYNDGLAAHVLATTGRVVPRTCPDYSFAKSLWFPTNEEFLRVHAEAVADGLFLDLDVYPHAPEVIAALRAQGATVKIATHRLVAGAEDIAKATTLESLARHGIEYDEIHFVRDKHEVPGDVYIDDAPYVLDALDARGLNRIVFSQEYNAQYSAPRTDDWRQIPALLEQFALTRAA